MKQRITYLLPKGSGVDAAGIEVRKDSLRFKNEAQAAKEWQLTLGLNELPDEIKVFLDGCYELHLRWISAGNEQFIPPLVSRLPAGLHVFFTPRNTAEDVPLCDLLRKLLGPQTAKCHSVSKTFSKPPILSERFAASSTYQYHQYAPISSAVGEAFLGKVCDAAALDACSSQIQGLPSASYVDVDFDAIGHAVIVTAMFAPSRVGAVAHRAGRPIRKPRAEDRLEVGVLQVEKATELEEISLGGYLTVIGEDDKPSTALFSFPSRHHPLPASSAATFKASFHQPTGLHPKLAITLPRKQLTPPKSTCSLHAYLTLPSTLFIDRYQLSDPLFLSSQNLIALHSLAGEQDLEAPDWVVQSWGSAALFQLATPLPPHSSQSEDWTVTIPTHLRYMNSTSVPGYADLQVPWPTIFWACQAEEGLKMSNNPFDRINLGYDGLFGPKTMFYHLSPAAGVRETVSAIRVPVLNVEKAQYVPAGTLVAVAVGFLWVCWRILGGVRAGLPKDGRKDK